jgi:hypothetical protein
MNALENGHSYVEDKTERTPESAVDAWAELALERTNFRFKLMAGQWFQNIEQ